MRMLVRHGYTRAEVWPRTSTYEHQCNHLILRLAGRYATILDGNPPPETPIEALNAVSKMTRVKGWDKFYTRNTATIGRLERMILKLDKHAEAHRLKEQSDGSEVVR